MTDKQQIEEIAKAWCEAWDKSRAKTAKEIFGEIYKLLNSIKKQDYEDSVPYYCADVEEFDDKLYILAEQFGVEVDNE